MSKGGLLRTFFDVLVSPRWTPGKVHDRREGSVRRSRPQHSFTTSHRVMTSIYPVSPRTALTAPLLLVQG